MKVYSVSDIHGHLHEFEDALSKVDASLSVEERIKQALKNR